MSLTTTARLLAFYLPQFHPIPENDVWWGQGFTEWTNVASARPLFPGHHQPHVPADLGFYDLRLEEARVAQAELARCYGIEGFCYWHYWFEGKRLLERPFDEVLASGRPDFPFCLAWANETWSRRWLGEEKEILLAQTYSERDDHNHALWLAHTFQDPRYIRVDGRPLFLVYRPTALPHPARFAQILRQVCAQQGLPDPFLVGATAHSAFTDCRTIGFDATLAFKPGLGVLPGYMDDRPSLARLRRNLKLGIRSPRLKVYDYESALRRMLAVKRTFPTIPCALVSWDNSPRRGANGIILAQSTPQAFEAILREIIQSVQHQPFQQRLVFVNAWNEWAEGNHLEPDTQHGRAYLESVRRANMLGPQPDNQ